MGPHDTALLRHYQNTFAVGQVLQHWRSPEVEVWARIGRTIVVGATAFDATHNPGVVLEVLHGPQHSAAVHVERHYRVGGFSRWRRISVAGADIQRAALRIERRRVPHSRSRGRPLLGAFRILAGLPR